MAGTSVPLRFVRRWVYLDKC